MALTSKFYDHHLDVTNHEVRNVAYENLAAAPASPVTGRFYYDTTLKQHRYWDGTQWVGLPVGLYKGEGNTFATLPAAATAQNGDVAVLSADDIGSGTALAPQYPKGIYKLVAGTWTLVSSFGGAAVGVFAGSTAVAAGSQGLVPAPAAGTQDMFLRGNGSFSVVPGTYKGDAATFAALPTGASTGDIAILTADDGANKAGVYSFDGANWVSKAVIGPVYTAFTGATGVAAGTTGLVPAPAAGSQNNYLKGDGTFAAVIGVYRGDAATFAALPTGANTGDTAILTAQDGVNAPGVYAWDGAAWVNKAQSSPTQSAFTGATALADGTLGFVPKPLAGQQNNFLKGDGTFADVTGTYVGSAATFATLPTGAGTGDIAILTTDTVGTGTATAPQFPTGVYKYDGAAWQLEKTLYQMPVNTDLAAVTPPTNDQLVSALAAKTYADNILKANDAMVFKGGLDASANPNYPAGDAGDVYKITVAGKVGGAAGVSVNPGDTIYNTVDSSAAGDQATVGGNWVVVKNTVITAATNQESFDRASSALSVAPSSLGSYVRKTKTFTVGDGAATQFTVTHNLNSSQVAVSIYDTVNKTDRSPAVEATTANSVTLDGFSTAPAAGQLKVTVTDMNDWT